MKFKATKKEMKENYNTIISIGYCKAQNLLRNQSPIAYSAGVYGWSCDYYDVGGVLISTGYAPIGTSPDYDIICKYDSQAAKISSDYNLSYEERKRMINDLLNEFIAEVTNLTRIPTFTLK